MTLVRIGLILVTLLTGELSLAKEQIAIVDTTVIDPRSGSVTPHTTVIVEGGSIRSVQPADLRLPRFTLTIDGRGKYLIPGLWDAHVHLSKLGAGALSLLIANGVTGVRDMGSNLDEVRSWRQQIEREVLVGPRILFSGPMLESKANFERMLAENGVENPRRQRIPVANPAEARAVVRRLAAQGVDQIKMRTTPDLATFGAVADEARRHRLPFVAHAVGTPDEMLIVGLNSVEHYLTPPGSALTELERRALFHRVATHRLYVSNTAANIASLLTPYTVGKRIIDHTDDNADSHRKYVCGYLIEDWREQLEEAKGEDYSDLATWIADLSRDLKEMQEAGVPMLAGSDAAVMFVYAGFSLHDELRFMVEAAKLAPMDVLRIATDGVPSYFGRKRQIGAIAKGQVADLVLLDANPLDAISNTRRIQGVMSRGHWHDRGALDRLLADVEMDARSECRLGSRSGLPVER